ncbi:hypothetical protein JVU11DRAFT_3094 [Chiua virens]|nr:hypothetical protein JVU11DRAFT_3094 [Chiua virens]
MLSRKQVPSDTASEITLLLGDPRPSRGELSLETLLIPVALATRLAAMIPQTTLIEVLRQAICSLWNISHGDPATHPVDGSILSEACDSPEIARRFSTLIAILSVTDGIIGV